MPMVAGLIRERLERMSDAELRRTIREVIGDVSRGHGGRIMQAVLTVLAEQPEGLITQNAARSLAHLPDTVLSGLSVALLQVMAERRFRANGNGKS